MYNLDMNLSLIIMLVATVVVFFIYFKMKIGSLQDKIKKLQKHLIYFNDMIEKHSETLRSTTATTITAEPESSTRNTTGTTNTTSLRTIENSKKRELMQDFDFDLDVNEKKEEEKQEVIRKDSNNELNTTNSNNNNNNNNNNSRTNSSPLTNILPLVSTVMTMMNTTTTTTNNPAPPLFNHHPMDHSEEGQSSAYIEDITPELSGGGSDKNMLLNEIQEELNELDSSITEQRENPSSTNEQIEIST